MKILHLTLKKKWFDMILSGEKKEEYREIKQYWVNRLIEEPTSVDHIVYGIDALKIYPLCDYWDAVRFTNGYSKNAPSFLIECKEVVVDYGKEYWGAIPDVQYFVIKLGKII
jgi:hypothetical protein